MNDKKRVILARCVVLQGAQLCLFGIGFWQKLWEMRDLKMWVETIEGVERIMGIKVIERQ